MQGNRTHQVDLADRQIDGEICSYSVVVVVVVVVLFFVYIVDGAVFYGDRS